MFGNIILNGKLDLIIIRPISEVQEVFIQTIEFTKIEEVSPFVCLIFLILKPI